MHHCLADFDFNSGNVSIHNRKSKAELCYAAMDMVPLLSQIHISYIVPFLWQGGKFGSPGLLSLLMVVNATS